MSLIVDLHHHVIPDFYWEAVFEEPQRRAAVAFVHPTASPDPSAHTLGFPDTLLDYPVDTSRAVAKLHYSNERLLMELALS